MTKLINIQAPTAQEFFNKASEYSSISPIPISTKFHRLFSRYLITLAWVWSCDMWRQKLIIQLYKLQKHYRSPVSRYKV